jgi:hypothetical protein
MSAQEIIAELPKLKPDELRLVQEKLDELQTAAPARTRWKRFAGALRGLPDDMARNHDHYLHGRPKK